MPARKKSPRKSKPNLWLTGVELYFEDLPRAKQFYRETLGLELADESAGHFAQFAAGNSFVCVERAVLHDTEGHNILLLDAPNRKSRKRR
jgi:catechol 2,3-dioxygenase-like lactoylglutathione lyase family enzyme